MARIRTIKPEFWADEKVGELEPLARLLFIGTWNLADDEGLLKLKPAYLKAQIFPYDDVTTAEVENILGTLVELEFIFPYRDQKNQDYGWIVNFRKHQRIDKPQKPKHPVPSLQNPKVRMAYAKRDDFTCHICGGEIPAVTDDKSLNLSLDHLKPRSQGGGDHPSNIRVAHFGCNAGKRDFRDDSKSIPRKVMEHSEGEGKGSGKEVEVKQAHECASRYAFEGETVRVNHEDYAKLCDRYPNLNIDEQLSQLDLELRGKKNWFVEMNSKLNYRNKNPVHHAGGSARKDFAV